MRHSQEMIREIWRGSVIVSALRAPWPAHLPSTSVAATVLQRALSPPVATGEAPLVDGSLLLSGIERMFSHTASAWREFTARHLSTTTDVAASEVRIRLGGWMGLTAALTHILLVDPLVLIEMPGAGLGWIALVPFSGACVVRPAAVGTAWRLLRSRWHRPTKP